MDAAQRFFSDHPLVRFIRLHWIDYSGILRTRFVPKSRFLRIVAGEDQYKLAQTCMMMAGPLPNCGSPDPQQWGLYPDVSSLRICGFAEHHAAVMCRVAHEDSDKNQFANCPRALLQSVLRELMAKHSMELLVGFELEFVLLDAHLEPVKSIDRIRGHALTAGLRGQGLEAVEEVVDALDKSGIGVHHFHTEVADQLEIALSPLPAIDAVDTLMLAQETVRTTFIRRGLKATFAPKPLANGAQNGSHMHISLQNASRVQMDSFLAGILDKLTSLCAFGMPSYDSYVRATEEGCGLFIGWGTENRDLPVRKVGHGRWEFRFLDATANTYLAMAAILAAGLSGIQESKPLEYKDCNVAPQELMPADLERYGITRKMPLSLRETLDTAAADQDIRRWIGSTLLLRYSQVKEQEISGFSAMSAEERRQAYVTYF